MDADLSLRDPDDTFKILMATDIHLGYNEKDPIRGGDSFETFEEVLQLAKEHDVDFVLLGGDLFDANKPSPYCWHRTVDILKRYTLGNKRISFDVVDNIENCPVEVDLKAENVNFHNPNLNIALPIFSVHGNHDDPTGMKSVSSLDTLSAMGLVNYIGRTDKVESLEVKPLILHKGESVMAIYGVGHFADKRLVRLFREQKVHIRGVTDDDTFQMMVLHQNRVNRGVLNYLPYTCIPKFMDLVLWGHEHDCYIDPESISDVFYVQPGSTVATSLSEGESLRKKVGILYVNQKNFYVEPLPLKTVRPFIFRHVFVESPQDMLKKGIPEHKFKDAAEKFVLNEITKALEEIENDQDRQNNKLPLVRLVVHYHTEMQQFNEKKFALLFDGQVANPSDIVLLKRIGAKKDLLKGNKHNFDDNDDFSEDAAPKDVMSYVTRDIEEHLSNLMVFTPSGITQAIHSFVNSNDSAAFGDYVSYRKELIMKKLMEAYVSDEEDNDAVSRVLGSNQPKPPEDESAAVRKLLNDPSRKKKTRSDIDTVELSDDDNNDNIHNNTTVIANSSTGAGTRGRGRGRGRGKKDPSESSTRKRK